MQQEVLENIKFEQGERSSKMTLFDSLGLSIFRLMEQKMKMFVDLAFVFKWLSIEDLMEKNQVDKYSGKRICRS